jgi:hypothetical protein
VSDDRIMTALVFIAIPLVLAALAPRLGVEDRPGFTERRPLI